MSKTEVVEVDARDKKAKDLGAKIVVDFDDDKRIYLKSPNRYVLGLALAKNDSNPVESKEIVINNSVIRECSDVELLQNDEYFLSVMQHVEELLVVKKSTFRTL